MPRSSPPHRPGRRRSGWAGGLVLLALASFAGASAALAQRPIPYPMTADRWTLAPPIGWVGQAPGVLGFRSYEGTPLGTMTVNEAVAVSDDAGFSNGIIDFDIRPLAYGDTGIVFRRQGNQAGGIVYLRANPDCPAADDCIQYAPITHGLMQWDIYPDRAGPAPVAPTGWNHVRLAVAGDRMLVYVNHEAEPSLVVPRLQGVTRDGGIAFKGPAIYANLVIHYGNPPALAGLRQAPADPGTVTAWLAAPPTALATGHPVATAGIPPPGAWSRIAAEPTGLVNLSRAFDVGLAPSTSVGWLKTVVTAAAATRRTVRIGWARQVSVFLNGTLVYSGANPY